MNTEYEAYDALENHVMLREGRNQGSNQSFGKGFEPYLALTPAEIDGILKRIDPVSEERKGAEKERSWKELKGEDLALPDSWFSDTVDDITGISWYDLASARQEPNTTSLKEQPNTLFANQPSLTDTIMSWDEFTKGQGELVFDDSFPSYAPKAQLEEAVTRLSVMQEEITLFRDELKAISTDIDKRYMRLTELEESDKGLMRGLTDINKEAVRLNREYTRATADSKYKLANKSIAEQRRNAEQQIKRAEEFLELRELKEETIKALTADRLEYRGNSDEISRKRESAAETYNRMIGTFRKNLGNISGKSRATAENLIGMLESIRDDYEKSSSSIRITERATEDTLNSVTKIGASYTRTAKAEQETDVYVALARKRERVTSDILELSERFEATVDTLLHEMDLNAFQRTAQQYSVKPLPSATNMSRRELPRYHKPEQRAYA
jgi:hypothetical protein